MDTIESGMAKRIGKKIAVGALAVGGAYSGLKYAEKKLRERKRKRGAILFSAKPHDRSYDEKVAIAHGWNPYLDALQSSEEDEEDEIDSKWTRSVARAFRRDTSKKKDTTGRFGKLGAQPKQARENRAFNIGLKVKERRAKERLFKMKSKNAAKMGDTKKAKKFANKAAKQGDKASKQEAKRSKVLSNPFY